MLGVAPWVLTLSSAVLYAGAAFLGRLTIIDDQSLSLYWPAAGVAALWFLVRGGLKPLDLALFALLSCVINLVTGASWPMVAVLLVANVAQVVTFIRVLRAARPELWGCGGTGTIDSPRALFGFMLAAAVAAGVGAGVGAIGLSIVFGVPDWIPVVVWFGRNFCGLLAVGSFGHLIAHRLEFGAAAPPIGFPGRAGWPEAVALWVVTAVLYVVAFRSAVPLAFPLLALTMWAGLRLSTPSATAHAFVCGLVAVWFTRLGWGPFASLQPQTSALFVQLFVILVVATALALATARDERDVLTGHLITSQRESAEQAGLFEAVLESMNDGVLVVDARGEVVFENAAALVNLRGTGAASAAQARSLPAARPDGTPIAPQERPIALALGGQSVNDFDMLLQPEGARRIISIRAKPLPEVVEGQPRAVVIFRDVTDERARHADLVAFAGVVAHDLRNPIQLIDGWIEALEDDVVRAEGTGEALDLDYVRSLINQVQLASVRMRTLIEDLLQHTVAGDKVLHLVPVDLYALVLEATAGRDADFDIGDLPPVRADKALLRQVIDNLIGNAIKYVAPGVRPQITVRAAVEATKTGPMVAIRVFDNGVGIPAGQQASVFRQFHRAHAADYPGTGLGLAICQRIIERHGGTITAADNPSGQGSVFCFTLPALG